MKRLIRIAWEDLASIPKHDGRVCLGGGGGVKNRVFTTALKVTAWRVSALQSSALTTASQFYQPLRGFLSSSVSPKNKKEIVILYYYELLRATCEVTSVG